MARVLVTGGKGVLGRHLVPRLLAAGHQVRVSSRRPEGERAAGVEIVGLDLVTAEGLAEVVSEIEVIVHAASDPRHARAVDVAGTRRLLEQATREGVSHLVYISIVGVDRHPLGYYRAKLVAEESIIASALPSTILRTTQFHDLLDRVLHSLTRSPVVVIPRSFRFQPVDVGVVSERLAALVAEPPAGRVPDLGGPEVLPVEAIARRYLHARGKRALLLPIPVPGKSARAFRQGWNTTPNAAEGTLTWEEFLSRRHGSPAY